MFKLPFWLFTLILFGCTHPADPTSLTKEASGAIEKEVLALAQKWVEAWNGKIDSDKMMATYHHDMKYVWRGVSPPGNYESFRKFVTKMLAPTTNYALSMSNVDLTIIDNRNAIVFFHFTDKHEDPYGSGAASLVMHRTGEEWKIIYVHESGIEKME